MSLKTVSYQPTYSLFYFSMGSHYILCGSDMTSPIWKVFSLL